MRCATAASSRASLAKLRGANRREVDMPGISDVGLQLLAQLADVSMRALCLALIAFAAIWTARSAAARHAIWSAVLGAMLVLPVLAPLVPPMAVKIARPAYLSASAFPPGGALTNARSSAIARPAAPAAPTSTPRWPAVLSILYVTVALGFLTRLLAGFRQSRRLLFKSDTVRDERAMRSLQELAAAHSMPWPLPRLFASQAVTVPITMGAKEPAILLPADWPGWDDWKLRAVLAHWLAHIRPPDSRVPAP